MFLKIQRAGKKKIFCSNFSYVDPGGQRKPFVLQTKDVQIGQIVNYYPVLFFYFLQNMGAIAGVTMNLILVITSITLWHSYFPH